MKWQYNLIVTHIHTKTSVRKYLSQRLLIPKHLIFQLRKHYRVTINHKYLPMNFAVHNQDQLQLTFVTNDFKHPFPNIIPDSSVKLSIPFENDDLMVVNKPRGYKTHPNQPHESGTVLNFAAAYLRKKHQLPYIVHRLDMETSGALIIAKTPPVVPILVRLIADKVIQRSYLTWVSGTGLPKSGQINAPIGFDLSDQRKRKVNGVKAKKAITNYKVIRKINGNTLLEVKLETGRTHQIRVHLASIGHSIIGDPLYNPNENKGPMLLHSWKVKLVLPFEMNSKVITVPVPEEFK
ncbi:pseudouridine synthase [Philodulcilactobacillus myokoensis]|uniref:Pseudouridine synthase n=1 Tax=Philodulcilactobacillus myokoensis TaxID=2929573 RepID=A0A9W6ET16_9LACO|nr:RluA family pseudouridine synthase [Philodulcilactobacillus myokoensis]GLB47360.1 pseudouridine synthase [Philodulcilactobacillus myokoensis]